MHEILLLSSYLFYDYPLIAFLKMTGKSIVREGYGVEFCLYCSRRKLRCSISCVHALHSQRTYRLRKSIKIVIFPTAGMYSDALRHGPWNQQIAVQRFSFCLTLSLTLSSKFLSAATFTHTHPSLSHSVLTLYAGLGTAEITTSDSARHSSSDRVHG
jgi:hypothetical protein